MPTDFTLPFTPLIAVANRHVEECGKPPCLIDETDQRKGRWAYFENQHGEQLVAVHDAESGRIVVYHGDCGWENPLRYDGSLDQLIGVDGTVTLNEPENMFLTAFVLTCGVRSGVAR